MSKIIQVFDRGKNMIGLDDNGVVWEMHIYDTPPELLLDGETESKKHFEWVRVIGSPTDNTNKDSKDNE
jgi:hypothetical protein